MTNKDSSQAQLGDLLSLMDLLLGAWVRDYLQEGRRHKTAASLKLPHHPENFMKSPPSVKLPPPMYSNISKVLCGQGQKGALNGVCGESSATQLPLPSAGSVNTLLPFPQTWL